LFGCTAKEWRDANPKHAKNGQNIRDFASINELIVLSNLESMNAEMVKLDTPKSNRYKLLYNMSTDQLNQLKSIDMVKSVRRQNDKTYIEAQEKTGEELEQEISKNILDKNKQALSDFNKKQNNNSKDKQN